ncbi:NAD(P)-binding Rossmann-fold superfamily protein [Striga asiatica]|uniref:NAD(P)-binding Rossmann-fold superfamily protein n=1 Tax=Striga asiatica TaxID=4170 RepID=A0A5A7RGN5_STRAF|nr:NAD(P)-binding Rossmann-fold superfamily protein [Striga asiatica]
MADNLAMANRTLTSQLEEFEDDDMREIVFSSEGAETRLAEELEEELSDNRTHVCTVSEIMLEESESEDMIETGVSHERAETLRLAALLQTREEEFLEFRKKFMELEVSYKELHEKYKKIEPRNAT